MHDNFLLEIQKSEETFFSYHLAGLDPPERDTIG